jgi:hypothetical protein
MKTRLLAGLTVAGALIVVGCTQDQSPSASAPTSPSYARSTTPTCSFSTASNDAKAYFLSNKDVVFGLLSTMSTAYKNVGPADAATITAGYDVLDRVAVATSNGSSDVKGTPAQGSTFVNDVFLCMTVAGYDATSPVNFAPALGDGLFAVRDASSSAPVVSRLTVPGTSNPSLPAFGAEPTTGNTWPLSTRVLFYGSKTGNSSIAGQTAAGVLFDLKTLPTNPFTDYFLAGVCDVTNSSARTLHAHTGDPAVILPPGGIAGFCTTPPTSTASRGGLRQFLAGLFTPQPLYAFALSGGGTGLIRGLSEIGPVIFTDSLAFQGTIQNAAVSDSALAFDNNPATSQFHEINFTSGATEFITVRAVSKGAKNALKGVMIKLTVIGNSGSFYAGNDTAVTDDNGYAIFPNYYINKAGGYTITASAPEFGTASTVTSNQFNISGQ